MFVLSGTEVVTGVFCSTEAWPQRKELHEPSEAIESATADKDVATIKQVRTKNQQVGALRRFAK